MNPRLKVSSFPSLVGAGDRPPLILVYISVQSEEK